VVFTKKQVNLRMIKGINAIVLSLRVGDNSDSNDEGGGIWSGIMTFLGCYPW